MNCALLLKRFALSAFAVFSMIVWQACNSCNPVTLKTIDLTPTNFATGTSGVAGSIGYCFSAGNPPASSFSPGSGQVLVGFDDFFQPGSDPFPCNNVRDAIFRAGVQFDVSQFDSVVSANFLFDTDSSVDRSNGETTGQSPPKSVATTLGLGTQAFSPPFPDDDEASLPAGPNIDVGVSGQVRDWITKTHPNFGFVIWGPRPPIGSGTPPEDNDAQVSFYSNFKLRVTYNPAQNPHAPQ